MVSPFGANARSAMPEIVERRTRWLKHLAGHPVEQVYTPSETTVAEA